MSSGEKRDAVTPGGSDSPADLLAFRLRGSPDVIEALREALSGAGVAAQPLARMRTLGGFAEFLTFLGSAGAFTALYQIIGRVLTRYKDRELTIARDGLSVSLKGHGLAEEKDLLRQLAPELLRDEPPSQRR
jgi:hypothetical protein